MNEKKLTGAELRAEYEGRGFPTEGVDFDALAAAQADDSRVVPDWDPPRVLPAAWVEVVRGEDGAKYVNRNARLAAILSCGVEADGRAWLHLSLSHAARVPTWGEMRVGKELFLGDREAYSVLPPRSRYVNLQPHCLHLFALLDERATALPDFTGGTGSL